VLASVCGEFHRVSEFNNTATAAILDGRNCLIETKQPQITVVVSRPMRLTVAVSAI
jgi:hypothetical protein